MIQTKKITKTVNRDRLNNKNFLVVQKKFRAQVEKYGHIYLTLIVDDDKKPRLCCIKDELTGREDAQYLADRIAFDLREMPDINCFFIAFSWQPEQRARGYYQFIVVGKRGNGDVRFFVVDYKLRNKKVTWIEKYMHKQTWAREDKLPLGLRNNISYYFLQQLYMTHNLRRLMNHKNK